MSWRITGSFYTACSCDVGCPCAEGGMETAGSEGCSAIRILDVQSGHVDGIDVSDTKVATAVDWPGALLAGNGTSRLYFERDMSQQQRAALERVLKGERG